MALIPLEQTGNTDFFKIIREALAMLTRRIDAALDAIAACRERVPMLRDLYRDGSRERAALDDLIAAARRANGLLTDQGSRPPAG